MILAAASTAPLLSVACPKLAQAVATSADADAAAPAP